MTGLGILPDLQSTEQTGVQERRYQLQAVAARLLPEERVAWCAQMPIPGEKVELRFDGESGAAYYTGLRLCESAWTCPVCAARASSERREELRAALRIAEDARLGYFMVTFTLQHSPEDTLEDLNGALNTALQRVKSGRAWQTFKERWGVVGDVLAYEVTRGAAGWHPHRHVVVFTAHALTEAELAEVRAWLAAHFGVELERVGRYASPIYGVDVRNTAAATDYITKWGLESELTGQERKNGHGYTPFQLLELYDNGDKSAGAAFVEYAEATRGLAQLRWSKGLRSFLAACLGVDVAAGEDVDLCALVAQFLPDETTEADETTERESWVIPLEYAWRVVVQKHARGRLLDVAAGGEHWRVLDFLESLGCDMTGVYAMRELEQERAAAACAALRATVAAGRHSVRVEGLRTWSVIGEAA